MNTELIKQILEKIRAYQRIIIMRHTRPDGDAVGSTKGLQRILQLSFPEKEIVLINDDYAEYTRFLGSEDSQREDAYYKDALGIVVDTGTVDRISNKKYALCREIVKIDHHIDDLPYGDISWVEDFRSSACEMIVVFYNTLRDVLKIDKTAATYLYAGMVTDSGRFKFNSTSGDTMRMAALLLDQGVDLDSLYANLYLEDLDTLHYRAKLTKRIRITKNGVAYLFLNKKTQEDLHIGVEEASATVSLMESIKGSLIWLAFIETDKNIRVRLRSRFLPVKPLASRYHGGGHDCASGATVYSQKEMRALIREADALLGEFKQAHEDCI